MEDHAGNSPIGRLLHEISWEGNARHYQARRPRPGERLLVEVFALLDLLPRGAFVREVLRRA